MEGDPWQEGWRRKLAWGEVVKVGFPLGLETKRVEGQRLISSPLTPSQREVSEGASSTTGIRRHPPHTAFCLPSPTIDYNDCMDRDTITAYTVYFGD
jgi:hypothetical protein